MAVRSNVCEVERGAPVELDWRANNDPAGPPGAGWSESVKAGVDFVLASLLLVLSAPVILMTAVLVKLTSRGPALYCQTRTGRNGRPYTIFKIRTMAHNCERKTGARWATVNDPRVTRVGAFLRRAHLDELPQLWNVLRGEMSLVGPRPERPEFVVQLEKTIPLYRERLDVRPGITGLAQVHLPPDSDLESVRRKLAYDLYYVRRGGFWLDLRILVVTGLSLFGIPGPRACSLLRVPGGEVVENDYKGRSAEMILLPEVQPT